jgi:hypothetical protein
MANAGVSNVNYDQGQYTLAKVDSFASVNVT